jgi:D-alanine-D-alanine ligase
VYGKKSVQRVFDSLRAGGHDVRIFEGDMTLLAKLAEFLSPVPDTQTPSGLVFNLAYGIQGDCRYTHVPAMLEMAGVPYTGSNPLGHALSLDKVTTKILIGEAGIPTPRFQVMRRPGEPLNGLPFPLVVKPRHESTSYGLHLVRNEKELHAAVEAVVSQYQEDALVEEYIEGREIAVGLLGNEPAEILPLVETDFRGRHLHMMTWDDKYHRARVEPEKVCPAPVPQELEMRLKEIAVATFHACHCRDYARVDIRMDADGKPFVLELNSMASLGEGGTYVFAAGKAGYSFESLVCRIADVAHARYFGVPAPRESSEPIFLDRQSFLSY